MIKMEQKRKPVLCVGDSLTFGSVGYSYIDFMAPEIRVVNKGINGDTTRCAYKRLHTYVNHPRYGSISTYVIAIGTNDVFLPYLSTVSRLWRMQMKRRCSLKKCITDDDHFKKEYEKYLTLLVNHHKKAVLVGIPMPELRNFPMDIVRRRNAVIKDLAEQYGMEFVDAWHLQASVKKGNTTRYSWKHRNITRLTEAAVMVVMPFTKDMFSRFRHLRLTVDGLHYNSTSARLIGRAISESIVK